MQDVALSWLVLTLTDSPLALGLTMTIRFLPALFFSLYGGVLADRLPKRRTLLATQTLQLVVALALAVLTSTDLITVGLIYGLAGLRGLVDAIDLPTRQAFLPEMVGTDRLSNAIALNSTQFNAARIVGPAVGAAVISTLGIAACFYLNTVSFLGVIVALAAMRIGDLLPVARPPRDRALRQLRDGLRYARSTPDVVMILIVVGAIGTFGYNFHTLLPLITKYLLGADASSLALLTTAMGAGSLVSGLIVAYRGRPTLRLLLGSSAVFILLFFALSAFRSVAIAAVLMFLIGISGVLFMTTANTRLQLLVPDHLRGRVMGMYMLLFVGTTPIGSILIGQVAEHLGVRPAVLSMAGLCAIGLVVGFAYARGTRRGPAPEAALEDEPGPA